MNTSFTTHGDEPVEARIVSWVLGEASAFEAAEMERLCVERPELMVFKRRMSALHGLLTESETARPDDEKWKLPPEKRKAVDEILGAESVVRLEVEKEKRIRRTGRRALLAIAACVVLTLVVLALVPGKYQAESIIQVRPSGQGMNPLGDNMREESGRLTPQFFGTEREIIKSREALGKVVDNLELDSRWGVDKETAVRRLRDDVEAKNVRGTDLLSIRAKEKDPGLAKDIANEVAKGYREYRSEIEARDSERQLAELNKAVRDQEDRVEERRKVLATIVRNKGIIYKGDDSFYGNERVTAMRDESREEAIKRGLDAQDYADAKREFETDQQLLQTMKLKQMGETISRKIPSESVVVHEEATSAKPSNPVRAAAGRLAGFFSSDDKESGIAANRSRAAETNVNRVALRTEIPPELIEGTPRPMNVPNLEAPADGPAGFATWSMAERSRRGSEANEPATKPQAPKSSMAKVVAATTAPATAVPVPDVDVTAPSLDFGMTDDLGAGFGGGGGGLAAAGPASAQAGAAEAEVDAFADHGPVARERETKTGSGTLSFDSNGVVPADETAESFTGRNRSGNITAGNRSGDFPIEKRNIDGILRGDVQGMGEMASNDEKQPEWAGASQVTEEVPVLGGLFSRDEKNDPSGGFGYELDRKQNGANTFSGGANLGGGKPGIDESGGIAASEADSAARSNSEPTDGAWKKDEGKLVGGLDIVGGSRFELPTGGTSGYHFKGADLDGSETAAKIEVAREFQYPSEYEPSQLLETADADSFPVTPATPAEFFNTSEIEIAPAHEGQEIRYKMDATDKKTQQLKEARDAGSKAKMIAKPDLTKLMEEIPAAEDPYSTFSLNISDASFQVAQAALAKGEQPDPAGIKVEQFYNAVDYGDPAPGANEPVAVNIEQSAHPVIPGRNLVRIALKTAAAGRSASQPLRLTLLVDQSGSMVREDRRAAMDKALAGLSELLTKNDLVTVIGFSRTPHLLADGMTGDKAGKLAELVNQSASEGGTNLEEAIKLGEQLAERQKLAGAQNRIVLFTDGAANLGNADPERLAEKVKQLRQKGIAFDIAGIAADGLNDELLGELARNGNGRYYVVGKGADSNFAKQLAGAFRPAAENVKVQVRFNPERVGRYKLIGFEKDRLKTEDFRNDKVDAAELAAEEAGVAIYQVEPLSEGNGELGEVSVRFRDTSAGQMVERTWTIPHDTGAPVLDRATPSMQLAVLSMLSGEKLKGGPLADAIDFKQFVESTANVKQFYGNTGRIGEMLRVVDALK